MTTYDDISNEQLAAALAATATVPAAIARLGLTDGQAARAWVRRAARRAGPDVARLLPRRGVGGPRSRIAALTDEDIGELVAMSESYSEMCERLGMAPCQGTYERLARRLDAVGIDDSHLSPPASARPHLAVASQGRRTRGRSSYTDEELRLAVESSVSIAGVLRSLGLVAKGGSYAVVRRRIAAAGIDTSHLLGQSWARGRRSPKLALCDVLIIGRAAPNGLGRRLIREGLLAPVCARCGLAEWQGQPIPLELEHKNGDGLDNRLANLELLCPNCHALTETWRGRNKRRRTIVQQCEFPILL